MMYGIREPNVITNPIGFSKCELIVSVRPADNVSRYTTNQVFSLPALRDQGNLSGGIVIESLGSRRIAGLAPPGSRTDRTALRSAQSDETVPERGVGIIVGPWLAIEQNQPAAARTPDD